jgi:HK97 family phage major capsid protein
MDAKDIKELEVFKDVTKQIQEFGADSKKNYEDLQNSYKKFTDEVNSKIVDKTKLEKLQEDMVTRQEAIDELKGKTEASAKEAADKLASIEKGLIERCDKLEIALKRPGTQVNNKEVEKAQLELKSHIINCRAARGEATTVDQVDELLQKHTVEEYNKYKDALNVYFAKGEKFITPEHAKTLSVGVDSHGGYTVHPVMSNQITTKLYESSPVRQVANVDTITNSDSIVYPVDWDEANAGWVNETGTRSETKTPDMQQVKIFAQEMYAEPRATQQLLEDSSRNIESWLSNKVAEKFGRLEATAFVTGDGMQKPTGFLSYASGTSFNQVEQINMGAAANITADGFLNVKYGMQEFYMNRGIWMMNRTTVRDAMKLKNGAGDYIWKPGITNDEQSTILGLPVRMATDMPTIAANALSVVLAYWTEAYQIVDRLGISVLRDPLTAKPYVKFYTRKRVGGGVKNFDAIKIGKIAA